MPHGDTSVYEAMVILAQDFSTRYPLVNGQGNFGSIDGDPAAAMRYTESKLSRYGEALLKDINKNTVDFKPNYDEQEQEPVVLPGLMCNILNNGTFGIAVGMATRIPSHNIKDVHRALYYIIDQTIKSEESDIEEVIKLLQAPDFATGGTIIGLDGVKEGYRTGKGKILVRGKYKIEETKKGSNIIITEIPYNVNKLKLIQNINYLTKEEKNSKGQIIKASILPQIREIRDESTQDIRIVIELKKDENAKIVVNNLIKHTAFQSNFNMNMISLVKGQPKLFNILEILENFLVHAASVIIRRSQFDLDKSNTRLNIVDAILRCLETEEMLNSIIHTIRSSDNPVNSFMELGFNSAQAEYIVDMKIRSLSNSSETKLRAEKEVLDLNIAEYNSVINNESVLLSKMKQEFQELEKTFGDERRTSIEEDGRSIEDEDLIKEETLVVTYTTDGTIKTVEETEYKSQHRGGKGVKATKTKEDEMIKFMFTSSSKDDLLFFTSEGRCHILKAYKIGKFSKLAKGRSINNYLSLNVGEKIVSVVNTNLKNQTDKYLLFVTAEGQIKKLSLDQLSFRMKFTRVITFKENDYLIQSLLVKDEDTVLVVSKKGKSVRFSIDTIRATGRTSMGVSGINVAKNDSVVDMCTVENKDLVFTITENGYSKRTQASSWAVKSRGGKGMIAHGITEKTGKIITIMTASNDKELFIATEKGLITRIPAKSINPIGRSSQGVKAINLNKKDKVVSVSSNIITDTEEDIETNIATDIINTNIEIDENTEQ